MAYVITAACAGVKDASCVAACPVDCIGPTPRDPAFAAAKQLFIDPAECICCGLCVGDCPVGAISPEEDLPPEQHRFIRINAAHFGRTRE